MDVEIDGETIARDAVGSRIPLDPGDHRLVARREGRVSFERTMYLASGETETVDIPPLVAFPRPAVETSLPARPASSATPPTRASEGAASWERIAGVSGAGAGIVALGLGVYFGLDAAAKNSKAGAECPTSQCSSDGPVELTHEAQSSRTGAVVSFSVGGALSIASVALLVLSGRHSAPVTPTAAIVKDGFRAGLTWTF